MIKYRVHPCGNKNAPDSDSDSLTFDCNSTHTQNIFQVQRDEAKWPKLAKARVKVAPEKYVVAQYCI